MTKDKTKRDRTQKLMLTALFSALITVGAFIKIPVPIVPFTMQMCFVNMAGLMLGGFYGGLSVFIYLFLGLIGIPIFAHGGGVQYIFNPTFGYLVGMLVGATLCGYISHYHGKTSYFKMILGTVATFICVYTFGLSHAALIAEFYTKSPIPASVLFTSYFAVFLPGDIATCALTVVASMKLIPILEKQGYEVASLTYRRKCCDMVAKENVRCETISSTSDVQDNSRDDIDE